ncbi:MULTISPECIES: serine protease [Actinosynnema]|uniref:S1 family peptidase n=1 Tax=Actinosynnema TaxID=40566 RepID=UPI0020A287EC|nr:serine protease [Actinosynnema pretiosum]
MTPGSAANPSWRVRLCDASGGVLGAGVLLDDRRTVLTCAHVVGEGAEPVLVDVVGQRIAARRVRVVLPQDDQRGDVALLELVRLAPEGSGTLLHRVGVSWGRVVRTFGYPHRYSDGVWTSLTLAAGAGPGQEWVQMNTLPRQRAVTAGFSGAGVADDLTGDVVGIVVSADLDREVGLAWMLPVETVLAHLPSTAGFVAEDSEAERELSAPGSTAAARRVVDWLARDRGLLVLVGADLAVLRWLAVLGSRDLRSTSSGSSAGVVPGAVGAVPEVGSVDFAVDATGLGVDEVHRRLEAQMGWFRGSGGHPDGRVMTGGDGGGGGGVPGADVIGSGGDAAVPDAGAIAPVDVSAGAGTGAGADVCGGADSCSGGGAAADGAGRGGGGAGTGSGGTGAGGGGNSAGGGGAGGGVAFGVRATAGGFGAAGASAAGASGVGGIGGGRGGPVTVVVSGVDAATDPGGLLEHVVKPLVRGGSRVALGFHRDDAPALASVRAWQADEHSGRLTALGARIRDLAHLERAAGGLVKAHWLRVDLMGLRASLDEAGLVSLERRVWRYGIEAEGRLARAVRELEGLRRLLDASAELAADHGHEEDLELGELYRRARAALSRLPADPDACHTAVFAHLHAVMGKT